MVYNVNSLPKPPPVPRESVVAFREVVDELRTDARIDVHWLEGMYKFFANTGLIKASFARDSRKLRDELELVLRCDIDRLPIVYFGERTGVPVGTYLGDYRTRILETWEIKTVLILLWENRI